jgi:hypothetical protein
MLKVNINDLQKYNPEKDGVLGVIFGIYQPCIIYFNDVIVDTVVNVTITNGEISKELNWSTLYDFHKIELGIIVDKLQFNDFLLSTVKLCWIEIKYNSKVESRNKIIDGILGRNWDN